MNKKVSIVVVGAAWYGDWAKLFYQACVRAGLPAEIVYSNFLPAQLGGSNEKAVSFFEKSKVFVKKISPAAFVFLKKIRRRLADVELLARVDRLGGEVIVTFIWTPGSLWVVKKLKKKRGVKLALWLGEPVERDATWEPTFDYFDALFMIDEGNWLDVIKDERQRKRMGLIPLASDDALFHVLAEKESKYNSDIVFIGKYLPARATALEGVKDRDVKIYGYGWEEGFKDFPWLQEKYQGVLPLSDSNKAYNGAKIAIGTLWFHKEKFVTMTQRTVDIALAGTFQASETIPLAKKIFGDSLAYFNDAVELKKVVDYYLEHEDERVDRARRSAVIARGYTYNEAVKKIVAACGYGGEFENKK